MSDFDAEMETIRDGIRRIRFLQKIEKDNESGCWNWTGNKKKKGLPYGFFYWSVAEGEEQMMTAHRASWLLNRGPILDNKHVLHSCHNASCVNPDHLRLGTHKENMRDREVAGRTSRGDKRYNWKRSSTLIAQIMAEVQSGKQLQEVCDTLGIGWQTLYRARDQSPELKQLMVDTKKARYSKGQKKSWEARSG